MDISSVDQSLKVGARERRGAVTALITIEAFRDAVEIGYEHRFEQHPGLSVPPTPRSTEAY
jgi:N-methylhydantoinase A/oxoprolinase/acetone carboxylase beta subunit